MKLRFLSTLLGIAGMIGLFFVGRWGFASDSVGLASSAFGLMPMYVALHSAISNDPLLICLCTWSVALMMLGIRNGFTTKTSIWLGLLIGLALVTKTTALALLPTVLFALYLGRSKTTVKILHPMLFVLGLAVLIPLGWWARNLSLYGDPLAMGAFNEAFSGSPKAEMFIDQFGSSVYWLNWVGWWTSRSFVGVFGYMDIFLNDQNGAAVKESGTFYLSLIIPLALLAIGGFVAGLFKKPQDDEESPDRQSMILAAVFFLIILALFVQFNKEYFQGQARYLYPAFVFPAVCMGYALCGLISKFREWMWAVALVGLGALNLHALSQIGPAFELRQMAVPQADQTTQAQPSVIRDA